MNNMDAMSNLFPIVGEYKNLEVNQIESTKVHDGVRKTYMLRNYSEDAVIFIGTDENVTPETGFPILPGEVVYFNTASDLWAVSSYEGLSVSNTDANPSLRVMTFS